MHPSPFLLSYLLSYSPVPSGRRKEHPVVRGLSPASDRVFIVLISSAIIEDVKNMREDKSALIAYYYFDYKDASKRGLRGLLTSLLFQLGDHSDRCQDVLYDLYTSCRDGSEQPSDAALANCLKAMLELPGQLPTFLIVDALDECPNTTGTPSAREEVLEFLEDLVGSSHPNLFICVTSRPEQDIQTTLNPLTSASRLVSLHEEGGQREDIQSYVRSFVHKDREMRRWRAEDRELVITTLSERAGGM
jgi:NACHT domain-containing protein